MVEQLGRGHKINRFKKVLDDKPPILVKIFGDSLGAFRITSVNKQSTKPINNSIGVMTLVVVTPTLSWLELECLVE